MKSSVARRLAGHRLFSRDTVNACFVRLFSAYVRYAMADGEDVRSLLRSLNIERMPSGKTTVRIFGNGRVEAISVIERDAMPVLSHGRLAIIIEPNTFFERVIVTDLSNLGPESHAFRETEWGVFLMEFQGCYRAPESPAPCADMNVIRLAGTRLLYSCEN